MRSAPRSFVVFLVGCVLACVPAPGSAQGRRELRLIGPDRLDGVSVEVGFHRGYAAVPLGAMERLGWRVGPMTGGGEASKGPERIRLREKSPFFRWNDALLQLTDEPYRLGDQLWVPLQLLSDFLPQRLADAYAFDGERFSLSALTASAWRPEKTPGNAAAPPSGPTSSPKPAAPDPEVRSSRSGPSPARVVIIDPGHGGRDPGAVGPDGVREKDVALAIGLALARALEERPDLEVHLTRTTDRLVPLWERGEWATGVKGDRPAIFISLHVNAVSSGSVRGFETYFLSEARTEHERRVAALENAAFATDERNPTADEAGFAFILKELRNLDSQHWSALLAELIQESVAPVHPGPNRGVKQGPLAVITNALMPAALVEFGFVSNRPEERLLADRAFQEKAARAIAAAVDRFFERYPPGVETGASGRR